MAFKSKVAFVKLKGLVFRVDLRANTTFQDIKVANLFLDADTIDQVLSDSLGATEILTYDLDKRADDQLFISEQLAYAISRPLTDSMSITESIDILRTLGVNFTDSFSMADAPVVSFAKGLTDTTSITEVLTQAVDKGLTDNTNIVEVAVLTPNLGKSDSVSMSESLERVVQYARSFSDAVSLDDRTSLADPLATDVNAFKNNIATMSEILTYAFAKERTDSFSMSDSPAIALAKLFQTPCLYLIAPC